MLHKFSQIFALGFTDMDTPITVGIEGISEDVSSTYFVATSFGTRIYTTILKTITCIAPSITLQVFYVFYYRLHR